MLPNINRFTLQTKELIILASKSEVRKKILKQAGLKFKTVPAELDEDFHKKSLSNRSFSLISKKLAEEKALKVSKKYKESFVIGADQVCVFGKMLVNKPLTKSNAIKQLMILRGKKHKQVSGCCVCKQGKILYSFYKTAILTMRKLSKKQIEDYVNCDMPIYSCGSYKYESKGYLLFSDVVGDQFTIQGLPILSLFNYLLEKKIISYA
ncbi:MAG: nucleoside triphosphate pyrophosphatase [Pseudomonadota bacterium]|nr:nucleoside triphosphate pyrophosphatase [Pseudomonadota bacterium]